MTNNKEDNIKCLVQSVMTSLIGCDSFLEDWWRKLHTTDKRIILEEIEDVVYDWSCQESVKNSIIRDEIWLT